MCASLDVGTSKLQGTDCMLSSAPSPRHMLVACAHHIWVEEAHGLAECTAGSLPSLPQCFCGCWGLVASRVAQCVRVKRATS